MTQMQMIEMVKQHFPKTSDAEIRILLNTVRDEFVRQSKCGLVSGEGTVTDILGIVMNGGGIHEIKEVRMKNPDDVFSSTEIPKVTITGTKEEGAI